MIAIMTRKRGPKKAARKRPPTNITLGDDTKVMGRILASYRGTTLSRMVDEWVREEFRRRGLEFPERSE